jgi:hypothetical protein
MEVQQPYVNFKEGRVSVRREVLYNIVMDLVKKPVALIAMF